ncbi:MAG TPA: carboxypeptidase regulatory-like domain-containing protein [Bryobacteraceae bacterium]|nr:carboxypeptidase regulatory-like domain-containing protein [Bryobacteraceae bacterium]
MKRRIRLFAAAFLLSAVCLFSQNVSGTLSGVVKDPGGAVIPAAEVTLINAATGVSQKMSTNESGMFVFSYVLPGTYNLEVSMAGFRTVQVRDITVTATERRSVGEIALQVGQLQERVQVTAEATPVQTASSERAGLVSGDQMQNLAIKGRDFLGLLATLPGIVDTRAGSREVVMTGNVLQGLHINGGRETSIMYALDGISAVDTGSNTSVHNEPNMDSIAEVKVLTSNYQAEYGRNSAGTINVVIKSGTQDFHGSAYWYYRHEGLNANGFFQNRTNTSKPIYRFNSGGGSIGGPVYIPGKFNTEKNKLFFFFSEEVVRRRLYPGVRFVTTPTQLQRQGDFSKTFDTNGALIQVKDPLTQQQFPGNVIPKSRINTLGQSILNFYPLPNYTDADPKLVYSRNYRSNVSGNNPRHQEVFRTDYSITPSLNAYFRFILDKDTEEWPYGSWVAGDLNYDLTNTLRPQRGRGGVLNITKVINPTMVNEFTMGASSRGQKFNPVDPEKVARARMANIGQWYPASNESGAVPNVTFGGVANYINNSLGNIPYTNSNPVFTFSNNLSKVLGTHSLKAGIYIERMRKDEVGGPNTRGAFDFGRNTSNPFDSNYAFSNALLGNFNNYAEGTFRPYSHYRYTQVEFYMQDAWRVSRKLTLDFGVRFYNAPQAHDDRFAITTFDPSLYDPSKTARLIQPFKNAAGKRVGVDPRTGTEYPVPYIGLFVPGSGTYAPGMVVGGKGYNPSLYDTPLLSVGPRIGLAYDPKGDGKMAIRAGFGVFYDRPQGNVYSGTNGQPPVAYTPTLYFGTLDTFLDAQGAVGPSSVNAPQVGSQPLPLVMNYSLSVQRDIGFGTVVDAAYVGSMARHLLYARNINAIPMYAKFDPANKDVTTGSPLPNNFLRPYLGLGNINVRGFGATSNYNAFQLTVNRRMSRGMQFGASYTFSKALGVGAGDFDGVSPYFDMRQRNYGLLSYDVTHMLSINYAAEIPSPSKTNKVIDGVFGNWLVSGVASFSSGTPFTPGLNLSDGADLTGSDESARITILGDPFLSKGERTFERNFKTEMFARTAVRDFGNAGIGVLRGPGVNNWDISVSKRIPLYSERRYLQFRSEFYNAFNHTQFSGFDTAARFDPSGKQINANFGAYNGARDARRIQLSLRFMF